MNSEPENRTVTMRLSEGWITIIDLARALYKLPYSEIMALILERYISLLGQIESLSMDSPELDFIRNSWESSQEAKPLKEFTSNVSLSPEIWAKYDYLKTNFGFDLEAHGWKVLRDMLNYYPIQGAKALYNPPLEDYFK